VSKRGLLRETRWPRAPPDGARHQRHKCRDAVRVAVPRT